MKSAIILVVILMWLGVIAPFSIMDKLSIDNLTTTPDDTSLFEMSTDDSLVIDTMDVVDVDDGSISNHTNETESLDLYIRSIEQNHRAIVVNHSAFQSELISSDDQMRRIVLKEKSRPEARSFFGLIIIPYIVCFFASKGFWPFYPAMLQYQVNEMGKKLFQLSDDRIRQFCRGKFNFQDTCYRPVFYKGYFVPIDAVTTECPPISTVCMNCPAASSEAPASSAQSWGDAPAKIAAKSKPQKNTDVEVFNPSGKRTTSKPKLETLDGEKPQSNINIEIHNVFSFASPNNTSSDQPQNGQPNNKISIPSDLGSTPHIIYA